MKNYERKNAVLVALQQALLGEISDKLRAVTVSYDEESIHFVCYFDGEIQEDDWESMSCVETELLAQFPDTHQITRELVRCDCPVPIPKDRIFVFWRKEPGMYCGGCSG